MHPPSLPRQIRTRVHFMGLPKAQLSQAENKELQEAKFILLKCIRHLALCHQKGLPFLFEQLEPWGPEDDNGTLFDFPEMIEL